jgi:hypothetical protein
MRFHVSEYARPNMKRAIDAEAPVAGLLFGLAYIGAMSGFYYQGNDRARYEKFVESYLSPALSGCDYSNLDLYKSLRCPIVHGLLPGHRPPPPGRVAFRLTKGRPDVHGKKGRDGIVWFDVEVFSADVLGAARQFVSDVQEAMSQTPEPVLLKNFKARIDEGYSVLVSG